MNTNTKNPIRIAATAVALFAALSTGAHADAPQLRVKYTGLNINNPAGAAVLYQRIRRAADEVCNVSGSRDLARLDSANACAAHAVADAVATVNNPALTNVYRVKMGGTAVSRLATIQ